MSSFLPQTLILKAKRAGPQTVPKMRRSLNKGFTLIEVMLLVLIMAIVAMIGLPTLSSALAEIRLSGTASEIVTALEYAQVTAMCSGARTRVTIDDAADTILVERFRISGDIMSGATEIPENDIDSGTFVTMAHPLKRGENFFISLTSEDRFKGVDISSATFGAGNFVSFDTLGAPSEGGSVTLVFGTGSRQATITVDPLTGKVTSS